MLADNVTGPDATGRETSVEPNSSGDSSSLG